jgi:glycosyltransferase involved in cell wall biosynthesis
MTHDPMKRPILFLDQTSSWGGAQHVLKVVLGALDPEFIPIVALPEEGSFANELRRRGIETLILPLGTYRSGRKTVAEIITFAPRSLYCAVRLAQTIRRRNVRLVYINGPRCLLAGVWAARLTGIPSLFHIHLTMTRATEIFVMRLAAPRATKIVACCQAAAAPLLERFPPLAHTMEVVYNPVRPLISSGASSPRRDAPPAALINSSRPIVGLVGRICPQKGQEVLLRAAAHLKARGRNIHLVFLGAPRENSAQDTDYARFLKSRALQLGLGEQIEWVGYQSNPNPYYAVFDVLVVPFTASEGLPLSALEALQWGIPVVGSRLGGIPEVVRHGVNGLLVPPQDYDELAESLEAIFSDPDLRLRLELGARATIDSRFSIETFNKSILRIVSGLCKTGETAAERRQAAKIEVQT